MIETEYCEEIEDDDEVDDWFDRTRDNIYKDLHLFTGLKVLRLQEVGLADFSFLQDLNKLEVLELAESDILEYGAYTRSRYGKKNIFLYDQGRFT